MSLVVTFDARAVALPGVGRFVTGLGAALARRAPAHDTMVVPLVSARRPRGWLGPAALADPAGGRRVRARPFGVTEQFELPLAIRAARAGVHHSPHLSVPWSAPAPVVLTVHDLFPLTHRRHARSAAARAYYRAVMPAAVKRAATVVAVSDFAAAQLEEVLDVSDVAVVEHGVDHQQWRPLDEETVTRGLAVVGVRRPYLLYVGTTKWHKNLATLLAAVGPGLPPLVLAGPTPGELARAAGGRVSGARALGRVADGVMPALYCGAEAVAVPSLYESVGLTALEAMACGTPVVASDAPGLAATVEDAAVLVPATDAAGWADALERVCADEELRARLTGAGRRVAGARSWERAADAYLEIYRRAAA
ncbi:MAG TPA: glycosyltransferase family 1 protein [Acidimicrobiales bacterium]|nr:glycosyltransferase family 1 protein [Acidimicrobiales bacterium]